MTKPTLDDFDAVKAVVTALEGFDAKTQERILRWTREKLGLAGTALESVTPSLHRVTAAQPTPQALLTPPSTTDIKTFVAAKDPKSDTQFAATVAYYYRFEAPPDQRKDSITGEDLQDACRKVGRARFPRVAQTLVNTHAQGLLDRGERGAYSINTVGENLVAMALPTDGASKSIPRSSNRKTTRKPASKPSRGKKKAAKTKRRS